MPLLHTVLVWVHPCSRLNTVGSQPIARSVRVASAPAGLLPGPGKSGGKEGPDAIPQVNCQPESRATASCLSSPGKCIGNSKGGGMQPSPKGWAQAP